MRRLSNGTIIGTAVLALALLFMLFYCNNAHAQQPQFVYSQTYTTVTADTGYATANAAPIFWKLSWTPTAASACTVAVDSSANGSSWTAGGIIPAQTCTSTGNTLLINASAAFVRVNLTAFIGTNVKVTLQGWAAPIPVIANYWSSPSGNTASGAAFTQNVASAWGIFIDRYVTGATRIRYNVGTADVGTGAGHIYNLALYNAVGTSIAACGATDATVFAPTTGIKACTIASYNIVPGLYFIVMTTDCAATCAALNGTTAQWVYVSNANVGATANGVLPGTISPPASSYTQVNTAPTLEIN